MNNHCDMTIDQLATKFGGMRMDKMDFLPEGFDWQQAIAEDEHQMRVEAAAAAKEEFDRQHQKDELYWNTKEKGLDCDLGEDV